jgi:hypothetical protein
MRGRGTKRHPAGYWLRIPVMAIGYSSRRRSPVPVIAIMAVRCGNVCHDGSAASRR